MADPFEPAPEAPALTAQDRGDGAQRRRTTMSAVQARESLRQNGPHNLGNEDVADDESTNFGSTHGDTIDSAITTLVGQLTGRDEDVQIDIFSLLKLVDLEHAIEISIAAAIQLDSDEPTAESLAAGELTATNTIEAISNCAAQVSAALTGALHTVIAIHTTQVDDLIENNNAHGRGDDQIRLADTLREEQDDKRHRKIYDTLEAISEKIHNLVKIKGNMMRALDVFQSNPETWTKLGDADISREALQELLDGQVAKDQASSAKIEQSIAATDKKIANFTKQRHAAVLEQLGVSASGSDPKPLTPAELLQFTKIGLMPEDKKSALKAEQIKTLMINLLTKHSKQFWAILPTIYRMLDLNPNRDKWEVPTAEAVCAADFEAARIATGIGPHVAHFYNQQNMDFMNVMSAVNGIRKLIEASQQRLTYGDDGSIERTVQGVPDDFIAYLCAFYWPHALTSEKDRDAMYDIMKEVHCEFLRPNQTLEDGIRVVTKLVSIAVRMQVKISYAKCAQKVIRAILVGRGCFAVPEITKFMGTPTDPAIADNCINMLSSMLAHVGRVAKKYALDHNMESIQVADADQVNLAVSSVGKEYSITPGVTEEQNYDSQIIALCPDFDRSDHVNSVHSVNFAGGPQAHGNKGKGGGKGKQRRKGGKGKPGGGGRLPTAKIYQWPSTGLLACQVAGCKETLTKKKSENFRTSDAANKSKAAKSGGSDPRFSPICATHWACGKVVTLNRTCPTPGKEMDMSKFSQASGHTAAWQGQKQSANAAVAVNDDSDEESVFAASVVSGGSTLEEAKEALTLAQGAMEAHGYDVSAVDRRLVQTLVPGQNLAPIVESQDTQISSMFTQFVDQYRTDRRQDRQELQDVQRQIDSAQQSVRAGGLSSAPGVYVHPQATNAEYPSIAQHTVPSQRDRVRGGMTARQGQQGYNSDQQELRTEMAGRSRR